MNFGNNWTRIFLCLYAGASLVHKSAADEFPAIYNSETDKTAHPPSAEESLRMLKLPSGFKASVFAAEPDVQNPMGMAWDARGRLWIAENYTYAERSKKFDLHLRDRILIFEDKNGDGRFDTRRVFTDEVQRLTSVEVGLGGVWALCPPQLLFFPDSDADGVPDSSPTVAVDGFKVPAANYHNFANGLHWGPDGWLYGRCGASAPGELGVPGTPARERISIRGGIWRYHPKRKLVEVLTAGAMNMWGHSWNEHGEAFFVNTVSGHLWHVIPGAHYLPAHTIDPNPRVYELIDMHADHWHFDTARSWTQSRDGSANDYGGGHAHVGAMVYLGDNWPREYRNHLFTFNYFGRRANQEILERQGSGYVGKHGTDCFLFGDTWFRGIELSSGPDGSAFMLDWSDTGECHESTGVHRTSGRIYKISYGDPKPPAVADLGKLSSSELVELHLHANEWFVHQARLELSRRASAPVGELAKKQLRQLFARNSDPIIKLRALWSIHAINGDDETFLRDQLKSPNEHIRTWAIRFLTDFWPLDNVVSIRPHALAADANRQFDPVLKEFIALGQSDPSGLVRLALATVLQRLPVARRAELAKPLLAHAEDAHDHNLPLMLWYGLIPLGEQTPSALPELAAECKIPLTRKLITRRLSEDIEKNPPPLNELLRLSGTKPVELQDDILQGMSEALRGWSKALKPEGWDKFRARIPHASKPALQQRMRDLSALFGDGRALTEVKEVALDRKADLSIRRAALQTLIEQRPPWLREVCEQLLKVRFLNSTAVRGLALFNDPAVGEQLVLSYQQFHPSERAAVIETLVSRPAFVPPLLEEIATGRIPRADLTAFHARQIKSFNNPELSKRLVETWGDLRESDQDKQKLITQWKGKLTPDALDGADKSAGRVLFNKACAACHTLYGHGGQVGPDLTGSSRDNLDYLLDNIVDPSAVVSADFRMSIVELKDGRILNALLAARTERTVTIKTQSETMTLERSEIVDMKESSVSIMPEGLLETMREAEARDLIAYLMHRTQVP